LAIYVVIKESMQAQVEKQEIRHMGELLAMENDEAGDYQLKVLEWK
jgi:hypothetical protein